jgi:hypothetical protein
MTTETLTFTGTNGDPWPSGFTMDLPSGSGPTTSIQGNRGRATTGTAARDLYAVRTADSLSQSDVTVLMAATSATSGPVDMAGLLSRYTSSSVCYRARARYDASSVQLTRNGTQVGTVTVNGGAGHFSAWRMRLRTTIDGANARVQVRYWQDGASEPGTWDIDYTDTSPLSAGKCGLYFNLETNAVTFDVDDYVRDDLVAGGTSHTRTISRVVQTVTEG